MMMPEGPEVRGLVQRMDARFSGGRYEVTAASILSGRYKKASGPRSGLAPENWDALQAALPLVLHSIRCKGKFIWFELGKARCGGGDDGGVNSNVESGSDDEQARGSLTCWSTLGMTGGWTLRKDPRHARIALHIRSRAINDSNASSETLYFCDMRNFGTFKVVLDHAALEAKLKALGPAWLPDPLAPRGGDGLDLNTFVSIGLASAKRAPTRPLAVFLMDQSKTSGIGNYILSEVGA